MRNFSLMHTGNSTHIPMGTPCFCSAYRLFVCWWWCISASFSASVLLGGCVFLQRCMQSGFITLCYPQMLHESKCVCSRVFFREHTSAHTEHLVRLLDSTTPGAPAAPLLSVLSSASSLWKDEWRAWNSHLMAISCACSSTSSALGSCSGSARSLPSFDFPFCGSRKCSLAMNSLKLHCSLSLFL